MPIDLRPAHRAELDAILATFVPDRTVAAFGSRATQTSGPTSDLDLCVFGDTPLSYERLGALRLALSESNLPFFVDIVEWATITDTFRRTITSDLVVVHEPAATALPEPPERVP
jgi:predicted nucleotidyltransferase